MLKQATQTLIRNIVENQAGHFATRLNGELNRITTEMARSGRTGAHAARFKEACESELEQRAMFCWQTIVRTLQTTRQGWYPELADDLKAVMHAYMREFGGEMNRVFHHELQKTLIFSQLALTMNVTDTAVVRIFDAEIDLYAAGLEAGGHLSATEPRVLNQYVFQGAVTSVQTGDNAIANIVINPEQRDGMVAVLREIRAAIDADRRMAADSKREALEVTDDCSTELQKATPNKQKLLGFLRAINGTISLLANSATLAATYQAAAAALGITLG